MIHLKRETNNVSVNEWKMTADGTNRVLYIVALGAGMFQVSERTERGYMYHLAAPCDEASALSAAYSMFATVINHNGKP